MTFSELKDNLWDIVSRYFNGAEVAWAETNSPRPSLPFITLKTGSIKRHQHPTSETDNNGSYQRYFDTSTILEVNLYTKGAEPDHDQGEITSMENTAVGDLNDFVNYMSSEYVQGIVDDLGITITLMGDVRDVSGLLNDTSHEYRAMVEFAVSFIQCSTGAAGFGGSGWKPTPSGGGTAELASKEVGYFDKVAIKEEDST